MIDYNRIAGEYAIHRKIHPGVLQQLIEHGDVTGESRVLEVGCGTGNYLTALAGATGSAATGVDPSQVMLAAARERAPDLTWLSGRGEALPLPDGAFDLVYSVDVIHHVHDRPAHFTEVLRVLAPGGRFCIATDSEEDIRRRVPLTSHFPETVEIELARYPKIVTLIAEMRTAGFGRIELDHVELEYELTDVQPYRDRAFSSLHLIDSDAFEAGIARLESDLAFGSIRAISLYTLLWGSV
jgi:ubiquinone/menaquinone biosynthesis C-methylase UbiE